MDPEEEGTGDPRPTFFDEEITPKFDNPDNEDGDSQGDTPKDDDDVPEIHPEENPGEHDSEA